MHEVIVKNLGKHFGQRVIFRRMSFELSGGESLAVTGANGSGKSTLMRMLAGVLSPSKGTVHLQVAGKRISDADRPLMVGMVSPYLNVYDGLSARENLQFIARARHSAEAVKRIDWALDFVGLTRRADDPVATYSSGMKQRAKFAAALLTHPPLLLLDEPTSNLDAAGIAMVDRVIERQRSEGLLLIIATNDPEEAAKCEKAIRIEDFAG